MAQVRELIQQTAVSLQSRLEAELLLAHALGQGRAWLYAHADDAIEPVLAAAFHTLVKRRLDGEPMAYLLGSREFYGRDFRVTPDVLIPRPETELLIDLALSLDLPAAARVIDVGTGTGCIALTLAAERPGWQVSAVDLSSAALEVARVNRDNLGLDQVALLHGSLLEPASGQFFDLVISNPPYVADGDPHLGQGDLRFEPAMALSCGEDGLSLIRALIQQASKQLKSGGWLLIEHGHDQGPRVAALFEQAGFEQIETRHDLAGHERVTLGRRHATTA